MGRILTEGRKQRLVGSAVFALLALILLPWMFSDPVDPRSTIRSRFAAEQAPLRPAAAAQPEATAGPRTSPTIAAARPTPAVEARAAVDRASPSPAPVAPAPSRDWRLQLASYVSEAPARAFMAKLRKAGHSPHLETDRSGARTVYRVRLLFRAPQDEAQALQAALNREYRIQSVLSAR